MAGTSRKRPALVKNQPETRLRIGGNRRKKSAREASRAVVWGEEGVAELPRPFPLPSLIKILSFSVNSFRQLHLIL